MDKGEYTELQEKFEDLQRQYDELRIVVARAGIPLPPEEHKRPSLTLIKGGLAAIVGLLGGLLWLVRQRPVVSGVLVASITALGVVAGLPAPSPTHSPRMTLTAPAHRPHRRRISLRASHAPSRRRSHRAVRASKPVAVSNHWATPAASPTLPQTQPSPQPTPTPKPPVPTPHSSPPGKPKHAKHCRQSGSSSSGSASA